MKKVFLVFMFVCIGLLQIAAQSFTYTDDSGVTWGCSVTSSDDKTAQITSVSNVGAEVVIPEKVSYGTVEYTVTSIGEELFMDNTTIEKVTWASTVTTIPNNIFYNCSNLKVINNTDLVTVVEDGFSLFNLNKGAFYGCSNLKEIQLPNCKSIGTNAFSGCSKLSVVTGMGNVETISDYAFYNCASLQSVDLTNSKSIGGSAFSGCSKLANITGMGNLETIPENAFNGCASLQSVDLTNSKSIGGSAFSGCSKLSVVTGMGNVETISDYAFYNCASLQSIDLTNSKSIGGSAFSGCSKLSVVIGMSNLETIPSYAFNGCVSLQSVDLTNCKSIGGSAFSGCSKLSVVIGMSNLETIPSYAFNGCVSLQSVDLTNCKSIGGSAFSGCSKLSVVIGMSNLETIPSYAFNGCVSLQSVDLTNCKSIGDWAFSGCSKLSSVIGMGNIEIISNGAFYNCASLSSVDLTNCKSVGGSAFYICKGLQSVELPKIETLGSSAFKYTGITKVTLPETLTSMGSLCFSALDYTFNGNVPPTLSLDENDAFGGTFIIMVPEAALKAYKTANVWSKYADKIFSLSDKHDYDVTTTALDDKSGLEQAIGATNMKKVISLKVTGTINSYDIFMIRNKMTNLHYLDLSDADIVANNFAYYENYGTQDNVVGQYFFYRLANLSSLKLPKSAISIGDYAIEGCTNIREMIIPNGYVNICYRAFADCSNLRAIQFPPSLKSIGYSAFGWCNSLKEIELPGLDNIESYAFNNCTSLTELRVPSTLKSIGDEAFSGCTSLTDIYTYTIEPISIGQNTFDASTYTNARLWMPTQSYTNYYYNTQWGQFDNEKYNWFDEPYKYFYINKEYTLSDENSASKDKGRFDGDPDIDINPGGGLIVEGDKDQGADDIHLKADGTNWATIIAKANVDAKRIYIDINVTANRWHFFCFPFDVKRSNISCSGSFVFRYYNGKTRAEKGFGGWTDLPASEEYLKAGKGYIFQTSADCTLSILIEKEKFGKLPNVKFDCNLEANAATNEQDASWNFVGNPFTSFFDLNDMGYNAPVTRWNGSSYEAVRPGDDDYIFHPYEAFFVQRPADSDNIEFDPSHRMTQTGRDNRAADNALRAMKRQLNPERLIVNLLMTDGKAMDKTRVVFNPTKSNRYERDCDAAKFESNTSAVQLYSVEAQGGKMAINERPAGSVQLGYKAKTAGDYTISALRMDQPVLLRDNVMNITHDLSNGDYTFTTEAGTFDNRFMLLLDGTTGIADIANGTGVNIMPTANGLNLNGVDGKTVSVYSLSGALVAKRAESGFLNLANGVYVVEVGKMKAKVMVK